jgi:hypothetical protein
MRFGNPITGVVKDLRDDMTRVVFTLAVYAAVLAVGMALFFAIPIVELRLGLTFAVVVVAALITRVSMSNSRAIEGGGESRGKIRELERTLSEKSLDVEKKEREIALLRADLRNTKVTTSGKLHALLELNIAEIDTIHRKTIDYLIHPKIVDGRPKQEDWASLEEGFDAAKGSARVIGTYRYPYKAKLGINLRDVRGALSKNGTLRYCLPEPQITGVLRGGADPSWEYKIALRNDELPVDIRLSKDKNKLLSKSPFYKKDRWVWEDETKGPKSYDVWSEVKDEVHSSILSGGSLAPELKQIADQLAESLFEGLVRSLFADIEPVRVPLEEIVHPLLFTEIIDQRSIEPVGGSVRSAEPGE